MLPFKRSKKQDDPLDYVEDREANHYPRVPAGSAYPMKGAQDDGLAVLQIFALDYRSLALLRVLLGLTVFIDMILRSRNIWSHYAALGVWPVVEAIANINPHSFSFMFSNGNMPFLVIYFILTCVVALVFAVGYKTRAANVVLWLLVLSIHNRNVLVLNSGDDFMRMMLFWGMFLPLGERFSVDNALQGGSSTPGNRCLSLASFAFIAQVAAVFWVGYMLKTGIEWEEGTAMYYIFSTDLYASPFAYIVLRFPVFLKLLTSLYLWFELLVPIMFVFPVAHGMVRTLACSITIVLFSFLTLNLELGLFTYAPMIAAAALLPSWFWETVLVSVSSSIGPNVYNRYWSMGGSLTLYYSPGAYSHATKFLLQIANSFLGLNSPILAAEKQPTQSHFEGTPVEENSASDIGRIMSESNLSWLAVDGTGRRHMRHRGFLALLAEVPFFAPVVPILYKLERPVAYVYGFYAFILSIPAVQYALACGAAPSPVPPRTTAPRRGRKIKVLDLVAFGFLLYVLWWNVGTVNAEYQVPQSHQWLGMLIRVDQWWSMFAPYPMKDDGWFMISGKLANGKELDIFKPNGGTLSYDKPKFVSKTFQDHRWRRFLMNLYSPAHQEKRLFYGRYLCRQWNWYGRGGRDREYKLSTFKIIYMREITLPNYKVKGPEPMVLWEHQC